jgi:hypothetical protein
MKIRALEAELLHADGQTDVMKLTAASRNFGKAPLPKKISFLFHRLNACVAFHVLPARVLERVQCLYSMRTDRQTDRQT